jgi:hypothetical protein
MLIGRPVSTAGNHRCMLPCGERCPGAHGSIIFGRKGAPTSNNRHRRRLPGAAGAASLCKAFGPDGKLRRYQASGWTKQDVIEAPKKKSAEIDAGLSTS